MFDFGKDAPWMQEARCAYDSELPKNFFDEKYLSTNHKNDVKLYCSSCPVFDDCLSHAITKDEIGIWAGTTERERRSMKKKARKAVEEFLKRRQVQLPEHGNPSAFLNRDSA